MVKLEDIHSPQDVKKLKKKDLSSLCAQLRKKMITTVASTGGHLSSNLGVVELTVALHRVFDTPRDTLVWDVGHQCYAHKMLTDRYDTFDTLRQKDGISGFPKPSESVHDSFITGHSSTAISAANGIAKAKELRGDDSYTVAILGDGAMTGGLAYEGLSNAGRSDDRLIVILNDNKMSISKNVGFVFRYSAHLRSRVRYVRWKQGITNAIAHIPFVGKPLNTAFHYLKVRIKRTLFRSTSYFENMGFYYLGPVDGHNLKDLTQALMAAKAINRPVFLHVATVKGRGYSYAEKDPDIYHGIGGFDAATGAPRSKSAETFSDRCGKTLCRMAEEDERIVAVTAAMKKGTCLDEFATAFPDRFFDTGIAEGHAVTFSSGMACTGLLPVFVVYSTFLQRSFDQLLNDTSIMNNHVVLAIDRAGIVPDDGETHQGIFDIPMLASIPHTTVFAPCNCAELDIQLRQALYDVDGITAVRYPKGCEHPRLADYVPNYKNFDHIEDGEKELVLVTYGRLFGDVLTVAEEMHRNGESVSVLKLNRILPLDPKAVALASEYRRVLFFEESSRSGSIGERLAASLIQNGFAGHFALRAIEQLPGVCTVAQGMDQAGLDIDGIRAFIAGNED